MVHKVPNKSNVDDAPSKPKEKGNKNEEKLLTMDEPPLEPDHNNPDDVDLDKEVEKHAWIGDPDLNN
jgi:hypothetical protein